MSIPAAVIFLDVTKASDKVWYIGLIYKLIKLEFMLDLYIL